MVKSPSVKVSYKIRAPLKVKYSLITLALTLTILISSFTVSGFIVYTENKSILSGSFKDETLVLIDYFSETIFDGLKLDDDILMLQTFDKVKNMRNIDFAILYDREKKIKFHSIPEANLRLDHTEIKELSQMFEQKDLSISPPFDSDNLMSTYFVSKTFYDGKGDFYGMLLVKYNTDRLEQLLTEILNSFFEVGIGTLISAIILSILFSLLMAAVTVNPIMRIIRGTEVVGAGDLQYEMPEDRNDELGLLTKNFNFMTRRLKNILDHMESMVDKRTEELSQSLKEVEALKTQQDGDYFLTSLIVKPLIVNRTKSNALIVDEYLQQKKEFQFRNKEAALGGDICVSESIRLMGRQCTAFVNGDAMGKSIQGSGGALVLGIIFNSLLERTKDGRVNNDMTPAEWVRLCYDEIQKAFTPFDGAMYISATLGVIDDLSGQMFYINAEHPWTVLYRGGKATFLEEELEIHKFGMDINLDAAEINIRFFRLQTNDIILTGSDGRDDIKVQLEEDGPMIVNEDETKFLEFVEKAEGKLDIIVDEIRGFGDITDDLSLLSINYTNKNIERYSFEDPNKDNKTKRSNNLEKAEKDFLSDEVIV